MASTNGPDGTGKTGPGQERKDNIRDDDLERRRRKLGASLAARRPKALKGENDTQAGGASGYGQAFKLSSEFIAGVVVGVAIGWMVDRLAGTSPWGLVIFLLVGFAAGVLNVLRSAGVVSQAGEEEKPQPDAKE
ncbi:AtpZ/AtpI family protein [Aquamicrobium segne]|uniref:ATP synthase protein I n=1 Tax=Aquamicrobium segne TaxID=469547 RepID=A0ABW0GUJ3_9HYPH